ncbi:MAG TPA: acyl carrier protein [Rhizomicrobium sp.]|jgi:acyl carrier protein|nr:acyl carrier protein [Rhizomicrobium sp.]
MTESAVRNWVRRHLAKVLGVAPDEIAFDRTLGHYGLDSVDAVLMAGEMEEALRIEIDPASFLQYENFEQMIAALESENALGETVA